MADKMMRISGRDPNGLARGLRTDEKGYLQISSVGKTLIQKESDRLTSLSDVNFGANDNYSGSAVERLDVSNYKDLKVLVENTHDVPVRFRIYTFTSAGLTYAQVSKIENDTTLSPGEKRTIKTDGHDGYVPSNDYIILRFTRVSTNATSGSVKATVTENLTQADGNSTLFGLSTSKEKKPAISFVEDDEDLPILRTVNASPFAYDSDLDIFKVETTGRKEVVRALNIKVPPGSEVNAIGDVDMIRFKKFNVCINTVKHPYRLRYTGVHLIPFTFGNASAVYNSQLTPADHSSTAFVSDLIELKTTGIRLMLQNTSETEQGYDIYVYGVL